MTKIYIRKFNETHMIVESDDETEYEIEEYFKFFMQSAKFTPKFKAGYWDGYIKLYNSDKKTLYTGLFNSIKEFAELRNYELAFDEEEFDHEYSKEYITDWLDNQVLTDAEDDIEVRDYQFNAVLNAIYNKRQLIQSPTSSGKSLILYLFAKFFSEHGKKVLLMTDSSNLVDQLYTDWMKYSFKNDFDIDKVQRVYALATKTVTKPIVISTWQSQHSTKKKSDVSHFNDYYDVVLVDECFPGDVEILTDKGFIRFDELGMDALCAQYDNGNISFIKPSEYIKKEYEGELLSLKSSTTIDIQMTPGHELLLKTPSNFKKIAIKDAKFGRSNMKVAGLICENGSELTPMEKFMIAYQADGSLHYKLKTNDTSTVAFSFSKQRKIDRFISILKDCKLEYSEVNPGRGARRRFMVFGVTNCSKYISDIFDLKSIGLSKAKNIISEMVEWDGHKISDTLWYYSSTIKSNVDFYQAVAVLCGYRTNMGKQIDARKDNFNDVYRILINLKTDEISTQKLKPISTQYKGNVYCVRVPSGNIIVRRNGKVLVTGNCHKGEAASIMNIMEQCTDIQYKIGLTGSLKKAKLNRLTLEGLFGTVFTATTLRELIDRGEIADISIHMIMIDYGADIAKILKKIKYQKQREWLLSVPERMKFVVNLAASREGNTLVLFKSIDYGKALLALTKTLYPDIPVYYIDGDVSGERRNEIREILEKETKSITFGSGGTVATGWSVKNLHTLITSESVKSLIRILQSIGRALRKSKTKSKCTYFDICDVPVSTGAKNYFRKHAEERAGIYVDEQLKFKTFKVEL